MVCRQVAVLFKIVPDPEGVYRIADGDAWPGQDLPQVPSVFDENAVEAAVQLKEATQCKVVVFSVGPASCEPLLKRTLAMGADEAVLVESEAPWDSLAAARILAGALAARGGFDVVLCGREAADTGSGLVGPYVAQALGLPFLTLASEIKVQDGGLRVRRVCDGGYDVFLCRPPVLLTVAGDANRPRMPSVLKMLQVKKTPVQRLQLQPGQMPALPGPPKAVLGPRSTPTVVGQCQFIGGADAAAQADGLLQAMRAEGVL